MAVIDLFKKKYTANVWCNNCNTHSEVSVPKGVTVNQFVESGSCPNCGCATLIVDYRQIEEFGDTKNKLNRPRMKLMRKRPEPVEPAVRAPIPRERPSTKPLHYQPLPQPEPTFESQRVFKQPPVDFWTGKPVDETEEVDIDQYERESRRRRRRNENR